MKLDYIALTDYEKQLVKAVEGYPKEAFRLMRKAGSEMLKTARASYKSSVRKKTGNLLRGLRKGRAYKWKGEEYQIRVKNKAPHAHLIEYGHRAVTRTGRDTGIYVKGRHPMGKASIDFSRKFPEVVSRFIDDFINRGFY